MTARVTMWTLDTGVDFARRIEGVLRSVGYHVALGGGTLHAGRSKHDLDLLIYPRDSTKQNRAAVRAALESFGMHRTHPRSRVVAHWRKNGGTDRKWVEVWAWRARRVDLIFVR